jgi:hypothetical protein
VAAVGLELGLRRVEHRRIDQGRDWDLDPFLARHGYPGARRRGMGMTLTGAQGWLCLDMAVPVGCVTSDSSLRWPHRFRSIAAGPVYYADKRFVALISTNILEQDRRGRL